MHRKFVEYATAVGSSSPVEGCRLDKMVTANVEEGVVNAEKLLPFASEAYQISPKITDYVMVPVVIMPSDLPNRNGVAFPLRTLTEFNTEAGCLGYKTWVGKGLYVEHANQDVTKSRGIILDSKLVPMENVLGNLYKVVVLTAWDRTKDSILVNGILSGERKCYSMGSYAADFACSICGALASKGGCDHVKRGSGKMDTVNVGGINKLAYLDTVGMTGFEVSSVADPAFISAESPVTSIFNWNH